MLPCAIEMHLITGCAKTSFTNTIPHILPNDVNFKSKYLHLQTINNTRANCGDVQQWKNIEVSSTHCQTQRDK